MKKDFQDLSVLIVGCGSIGNRHGRVLRSLGVKDIRACDANAERVAGLVEVLPDVRVVESFETGLGEKPDTVFILTPPKMHIPMAMQALRAGCHVFSEKPLADTLAEFDNLVAVLEQSGRKMMVGHCFRYHEGLVKAKSMLAAGRIGRLVSIRAVMGEHFPDVRPDYKTLFSAKYSGAFDLSHEVDLAIWYAGQPVRKAHCLYGSHSDIGIEAPDLVEMLIGFEDRCLATVHLDFFQRPRRRQMELIGTEGVIIVEFASWDECTVSVYSAKENKWQTTRMVTKRDDMFAAEDREFLEAVAENKPLSCDVHEAAKSVRIIAEAQEKVGSGRGD